MKCLLTRDKFFLYYLFVFSIPAQTNYFIFFDYKSDNPNKMNHIAWGTLALWDFFIAYSLK
jgi:hypothetical protein